MNWLTAYRYQDAAAPPSPEWERRFDIGPNRKPETEAATREALSRSSNRDSLLYRNGLAAPATSFINTSLPLARRAALIIM